ncbi:MAG: hypothetical protein M1602_03095 [Firmicutes bacterium]|nr:hypothetical protein [Bacillota bacterium]
MAGRLVSGDLNLAVDRPDAPKNFPRVFFISMTASGLCADWSTPWVQVRRTGRTTADPPAWRTTRWPTPLGAGAVGGTSGWVGGLGAFDGFSIPVVMGGCGA